MSRGRILLIVGNGSTGVDREGRHHVNVHTGVLLCDLADAGLHPVFVEPSSAFDEHSNLQNFCLESHDIESFQVELGSRIGLLRSMLRVFGKVVRADHVYIFYPGRLPRIVAAFCRLLRRPYGLYVRGSQFATTGTDGANIRGASFVLTVSPSLAAELKRLCPRVATIRPMLGIDMSEAYRRSRPAAKRGTLNLLFVGRVEAAKGMRELMDAVAILRRNRFPFSLKVVGGGPLLEELRNCYASSEPEARVEFPGLVSDKASLMREYQEADVFIFPSHHEGFPRVLYEAMVKSLPILTTFVGGIPGRMKNGHNCIEIPVGDGQAIADAVVACAADPALLHEIGTNGLRTIEEVFETHRPHAKLIEEQLKNG